MAAGLRLANGAMGGLAAALRRRPGSRPAGGTPRRRSGRASLPLATAFAYVLFAAGVTGIDQQTAQGPTPFMVAVFSVAMFVRIPAAASSAVFGGAWLASWTALACFQPSETLWLSGVVNGTMVAARGRRLSPALAAASCGISPMAGESTPSVPISERGDDRLGESPAALQRANAALVQEVRVRAAAESELACLATNDPLTDVANRRRFFEIADRESERARNVGGSLAVAMIDVDHFKDINDRHGHAVGDEVLRSVAARCTAAMRAGDAVGRLGGDEVALLLVGATLAEAVSVAGRVAEAIGGTEVSTRGGRICPTVSIGVAEVNAGAADAVRVAFELADAALYEAKRMGRGRVEVRTVPPRRTSP